jgi:hypothetical protein
MAVTSCSGAPGTVKPAVSATRAASAAATTGSLAASPAAPGPAGSVPAGYKRVGGAAQGISVAAPASWTMVDLSKESPESAVREADPRGGASAAALLQRMKIIAKVHPVWVYDAKSDAAEIPGYYVANFNAACGPSGTTDVGASGIPLIKAQMGSVLASVKATHITWKNLKIGGVPGIEVSDQFTSPTDGVMVSGWELAVLPKPNKACEITATVSKGASLDGILSVAAATAQFP